MLNITREKVQPDFGNNYEVLFINNQIDPFLFYFFTKQASKMSGRSGTYAESTNSNRAIKVAELIKLLQKKGLTIYTAEEKHIKELIIEYVKGDVYKKKDDLIKKYQIKRNTINAKLREWFYMFLEMDNIGITHTMKMHTTEKTIIRQNYSKRIKTSNRLIRQEIKVEIWNLFLKPDPEKLFYKALSFKELEILFDKLEEVDIVYRLIAEFMYQTGLRVGATLKIKRNDFFGYFKFLNRGKTDKDTIRFSYVNKGGDSKGCDVPLIMIRKLNNYKNSCMRQRLKLYEENLKNDNRVNKNDNTLWLTKEGLCVDYKKVSDVFKKVSDRMGNSDNTITAHWMRHTFATHTLIRYCQKQKINLGSISYDMLDGGIIVLLVDKLGHATEQTIKRYIVSSMRLMNNNSIFKNPWIDKREFKESIQLQNLLKEEALLYYEGNLPKDFDLMQFGLNQGILLDTSII